MAELDTLTEVADLPVELGVADEFIAGLRSRLAGQKADTPVGYELVRSGIGECRGTRTGVEKSKVKLNKSANDWIRKVNQEAKRIISAVREIEDPLKEEKKRIDDARERIRRAKAGKIRLEQEAKERAEREAREKKEAAERGRFLVEMERKRQELQVQKEKLERRQAEQDARIKKLEAEKAELERQRAEQIKLKEAEEEKQAELERKKLQAEQAKLKAIQDEKERQEHAATAARLAEERKPDAEKLRDFARQLRLVECAQMETEWGQEVANSGRQQIDRVAEWLDVSV